MMTQDTMSYGGTEQIETPGNMRDTVLNIIDRLEDSTVDEIGAGLAQLDELLQQLVPFIVGWKRNPGMGKHARLVEFVRLQDQIDTNCTNALMSCYSVLLNQLNAHDDEVNRANGGDEHDDNRAYGKDEYDDCAYGKDEYDNRAYGGDEYDDRAYGKDEYDDRAYGKDEHDNRAFGKDEYDDRAYGGEDEATCGDEANSGDHKNGARDVCGMILKANRLLQGILLIHPESRKLFNKAKNMRLILAFLRLPNTRTLQKDTHHRDLLSNISIEATISFITLLIHVLLKNLVNFRVFEASHGCPLVIRKLKLTASLSDTQPSSDKNHNDVPNQQDLNFKVIEFLVFYLMDEYEYSSLANGDHTKIRSIGEKAEFFRPHFVGIDDLIEHLDHLKNL